TTLPMSMPYLKTVSPTAMSLSATLWQIGISWVALTEIVLSSSMIHAFSVAPDLMPSTTATATVSLASCSTTWIISRLLRGLALPVILVQHSGTINYMIRITCQARPHAGAACLSAHLPVSAIGAGS